MSGKWVILGGAGLGMAAVVLGAFGAHSLTASIATWGLEPAEQAKRLHDWEVGVRYQMYHALALLVIGALVQIRPDRLLRLAAAGMALGTLIFSGCLYAYVLSGVKTLGMIVPIGGVLMIVGWLLLAIAVFRWSSPDGSPNSKGEG